uniref:Uncharacterized protein n=1 Tax=Triticum urartu TaxID=4572 RepID=A0A8R7TSU1_TRIUA
MLSNTQDGVETVRLCLAASELQFSCISGHKMLWIAYVLMSVAFHVFFLVYFIWIRRWKIKVTILGVVTIILTSRCLQQCRHNCPSCCHCHPDRQLECLVRGSQVQGKPPSSLTVHRL